MIFIRWTMFPYSSTVFGVIPYYIYSMYFWYILKKLSCVKFVFWLYILICGNYSKECLMKINRYIMINLMMKSNIMNNMQNYHKTNKMNLNYLVLINIIKVLNIIYSLNNSLKKIKNSI